MPKGRHESSKDVAGSGGDHREIAVIHRVGADGEKVGVDIDSSRIRESAVLEKKPQTAAPAASKIQQPGVPERASETVAVVADDREKPEGLTQRCSPDAPTEPT
jgi:hypothetical protein